MRGRSFEDATGDVEGITQIVCCGVWWQIGPEEVEHLITVQHLAWGEREQLDYGGRFALSPGGIWDAIVGDGDAKAAQ